LHAAEFGPICSGVRPFADDTPEGWTDPEAAEAFSPLNGRPLIIAPIAEAARLAPLARAGSPGAPILVGVDRQGETPAGHAELFDVLLTTAPSPARPWVALSTFGGEAAVEALERSASRNPIAASVLATVLRLGETLSFTEALTLESLAYSTLLAGQEFLTWRKSTPIGPPSGDSPPFVRLDRQDEALEITLTRPAAHNALCAALRDELVEALRLPLIDTGVRQVVLRGEGRAFCTGGDLSEFGQASDPAAAHAIRTLRSPARLLAELGPRATVRVHGVVVGSGLEMAAAAARVVAAPHSVFRLPEVSMGLIPGAGGTVSVPRRIGRHRAAFMALSGLDVRTSTALGWGLIDAVERGR
jgi:hypothetical protein